MTIFYQPLYGVEPYNARGVPEAAPFGGGADVTQENLLITLFEVVGDPDVPSTFTYSRIKPISVLPGGAGAGEEVFGPGFGKQIRSRNACRLLISAIEEETLPNKLFLALLNPPRELAQMALDPDNPASLGGPAGFKFNSTQPLFFSPLMWDLRFLDLPGLAAVGDLPNTVISSPFVGGPLPVNLPWKTNGADGADPIPYGPYNSGADFLNAANAIKNGAPWFLPVLFNWTPLEIDDQFVMHVSWPHSGASRG